jgi:hypothetical protein
MKRRRAPVKTEFSALVASKHDDEAETLARLERMEQIEERLFSNAAGILDAHGAFGLIEPEAAEPPEEWVRQYGAEHAHQRLRVAKTGWVPKGQTPSGVDMAGKLFTGIAAARARRYQRQDAEPQALPVVITLPAPTSQQYPSDRPALPEKELDE